MFSKTPEPIYKESELSEFRELKMKREQMAILWLIGSGLLAIYSSIYLFYYFVGIFHVSLGDFGELIWSSGGAGSFFPLPIEAGQLTVITTKQSLIDYLLYVFVISNGIIYLLPLIFGALSLFFICRLNQNRLRRR